MRRNRVCRPTSPCTRRAAAARLAPVVDYATNLCRAVPVSGTAGPRDAIGAIEAAIEAAEPGPGPLAARGLRRPRDGRAVPPTVVTENGTAYKSTDLLRFIASRPELAHVRTRHHAPETNGVAERFDQSLKYEHLYRLEVPDVMAIVDEAEAYLAVDNTIRPHESLDFATPITAYLAQPPSHLSEPGSVQES